MPAKAVVEAAADLDIGGRTGVETLRDAENFSKEFLGRNEVVEGL